MQIRPQRFAEFEKLARAARRFFGKHVKPKTEDPARISKTAKRNF